MNSIARPNPDQFDSLEAYAYALRQLKSRTPLEQYYVLQDELDHALESHGEALTQYQSECALFGDAGPGQGLALASGQQRIADLKAKLARVGRVIAAQQA